MSIGSIGTDTEMTRAQRDAITGLRASAVAVDAWLAMCVELGADDISCAPPVMFHEQLRDILPELEGAVERLRTLARSESISAGEECAPSALPTYGYGNIDLGSISDDVASGDLSAGDEDAPTLRRDTQVATGDVKAPQQPVARDEPEIPDVDEDGGRCVLSANGPGFSVSGLIEFLGRSGKSGTLVLATEHDKFKLRLVEGKLVHAECEQRPKSERLGEVLLRVGDLPKDRVNRMLELCKEPPGDVPLGEVLEREGLVTKEILDRALTEQVQQLFTRLCLDPGEWFAFYEGSPSFPALHVKLNLMQLLLDSARVQDESVRQDKRLGALFDS